MKLDTVNKTNIAIQKILESVELESCVLPSSEKHEYSEYFKEIEESIIKVKDKFYRDWIHNNEVTKVK